MAVHIISSIVAYFILLNHNQPKYILNKFLDKDYLRQPPEGYKFLHKFL